MVLQRDPFLQQYLEDIAPFIREPLYLDDFCSLFLEYQETQNPQIKEMLIQKNLDLPVKYVFKRIVPHLLSSHYKDSVLDLILEGNFGLFEAFKNFDPSINRDFSRYALFYVKRFVLDAIDKRRLIYMPPSLRKHYDAHTPCSLEKISREDEFCLSRQSTKEVREDSDPKKTVEYLLSFLNDVDAKLLRVRYGLTGSPSKIPVPLREVGKKVHMTGANVQVRERKALETLRELHREKKLNHFLPNDLQYSADLGH